MKLFLATLALSGWFTRFATADCSETTILDNNFECVNEYPTLHLLSNATCTSPEPNGLNCDADGETVGGQMGGGFIYMDSSTGDYLTDMQNDKMILQVNTESSSAALISVPIQRDPATGRIIDIDMAAATQVDPKTFIVGLSNGMNTIGPDGQRFFSVVDGGSRLYCPKEIGYGSFDTAHTTFTENGRLTLTELTSLEGANNIFEGEEECGDLFSGLYGIGFSPILEDESTGTGRMQGTGMNGFFSFGDLNPDGSGGYAPTSIQLLCGMNGISYTGGFDYVKTGTFQHSIVAADFNGDKIDIVKLDPVTGYCYDETDTQRPPSDPTANPLRSTIASIVDPWGFFFDPRTEDMFVTTYREGDGCEYNSLIIQIKGFPPINDPQALVANALKSVERRKLATIRGATNTQNFPDEEFLVPQTTYSDTRGLKQASENGLDYELARNGKCSRKAFDSLICHALSVNQGNENICISEDDREQWSALYPDDVSGACETTVETPTVSEDTITERLLSSITRAATAGDVVGRLLERISSNASFRLGVRGGYAPTKFMRDVENLRNALLTYSEAVAADAILSAQASDLMASVDEFAASTQINPREPGEFAM